MEEKKALPDGIEWPCFTDGGPVGINDRFTDRAGIGRTITCIRFYDSDFSICAYDGTVHYYEYGEPVGPAPVLAADGEPLEAGQTVYHIADGKEYTVKELLKDGAMVTPDGITGGRCRAEYLTHERPVLDADGVEIRMGDTVWVASNGMGPYIVDRLPIPGETDVLRLVDETGICWSDSGFGYIASQLTHERPESWERLWMDMHPADETECVGLDLEEFVRRAKALAERERGE